MKIPDFLRASYLRNALSNRDPDGKLDSAASYYKENVGIVGMDELLRGIDARLPGFIKIKQLFNPFFTTKDPGKGTGLGLFIVRQVIEKNGGRIYLKETKVGEGTTFVLEFPAASVETKVK